MEMGKGNFKEKKRYRLGERDIEKNRERELK